MESILDPLSPAEDGVQVGEHGVRGGSERGSAGLE